jgi:signal peptidase II
MLRKSKNILFSVIPFLMVWGLDRLTKVWVENSGESFTLGFLKIDLVYNHGIMLGWLSHVPLEIKTTILVTLGAIILSSYVLLLMIFPFRSHWLRVGLSILTAGIIGNVTDRLIGESVVDFISFGSSPYFNLADICQWFGYAFIGFGLYQDSQYFWPSQDWRNKNFINPRFQLRMAFLLSIVVFLVGFVFIAFGLTFLKQLADGQLINYYLLTSFSVLLFLSVLGFIGGVVLSHRVAGPIYALEKYINASLEGKETAFKLRDNDEFKELEGIYTKLSKRFKTE